MINNTIRNHCHHLRDLIVGLDIEWHPNTSGDFKPPAPAATLQLCVGFRFEASGRLGFRFQRVFQNGIEEDCAASSRASDGKAARSTVTLIDWDAKDLTLRQIEYGSIDAFVSFQIGFNLFTMAAYQLSLL
nr:Werner Syndrome-like exonuclease [Ipomoea batatas]